MTQDIGDVEALIMFGITGDLARKMLFPALYELAAKGELDIPVVGVALSDWSKEELVARARESLTDAGITIDESVFAGFVGRLSYVSGDYRDRATFDTLLAQLGDRRRTVAYLAIPPFLFDDVTTGLASIGLNDTGRLVVEKPFGRDLASAQELNELVHRHYPEERVYRIDHFLGKEAVQNLLVYRFSNTVLEPIWNRHYVTSVQLLLSEDFGISGRGKFYDAVGALRDVVQNHLIQMLALLAMEPPVSSDPDAMRDERVKVLRAIKPLTHDDVVRGQVVGYHDEDGVDPTSDTETFVAVKFEIDSWRWAGVPWIVRAGKSMEITRTEAVVTFQPPPRPLFTDPLCHPDPNRIRFETKPEERIVMEMQAKRAGTQLVSGPIDLVLDNDEQLGLGPEPYERLLGDALRGDQALFARQDGVEEAWRIVGPVLDSPPATIPYQPGSWGPEEADALLPRGLTWATGPT